MHRYQERLEEKMTESNFFYSLDLLNYELHKLSFNRGGSYMDSPKWLKNEKATINPKNNENKYFQYAVNVALNFQKYQ